MTYPHDADVATERTYHSPSSSLARRAMNDPCSPVNEDTAQHSPQYFGQINKKPAIADNPRDACTCVLQFVYSAGKHGIHAVITTLLFTVELIIASHTRLPVMTLIVG